MGEVLTSSLPLQWKNEKVTYCCFSDLMTPLKKEKKGQILLGLLRQKKS